MNGYSYELYKEKFLNLLDNKFNIDSIVFYEQKHRLMTHKYIILTFINR